MGRKVIEAFIQEGLFSGEREYVQFFNHLKNSLRGTGWNYHNETFFYDGESQSFEFDSKSCILKVSDGANKGKKISSGGNLETLEKDFKRGSKSISDGSRDSDKCLTQLIKAISEYEK